MSRRLTGPSFRSICSHQTARGLCLRRSLSPKKTPRVGKQQQDKVHDADGDAVPPEIAINDAYRWPKGTNTIVMTQSQRTPLSKKKQKTTAVGTRNALGPTGAETKIAVITASASATTTYMRSDRGASPKLTTRPV
jgi:hypothetical protein